VYATHTQPTVPQTSCTYNKSVYKFSSSIYNQTFIPAHLELQYILKGNSKLHKCYDTYGNKKWDHDHVLADCQTQGTWEGLHTATTNQFIT